MLAAGGTVVVLSGATVVLGGVTMAVAKVAMEATKSNVQAGCRVCRTRRRVVCEVCQGERILRYWPTKEPLPVQSHSWSVCGMCEGAGDHACINCVGTGTVNRLPWEEGEEPQLGALTTVTAHEQGLGTAGH